MTERKYALTKIDPGDWMCPSNDTLTIWRFRSYTDGQIAGLMDVSYYARTFWRVQRCPREAIDRYLAAGQLVDDLDNLPWVDVEEWLPTRRAAIAIMEAAQ